MALNYVTLTVDMYDGAGSVLTGGTATFTPSVQLTDATDHEIITEAGIVASFKPSGSPAVRLLATDNGNPLPTGWAWTVTFAGVPGNPPSFSFFLPFSGGSAQNLSAISPVSTAVTQYPLNPMTTAGDMIYGAASPAGTPARLGIGSTGYVLTVSGGLPTWAPASGGFNSPMTTLGDTLYENATPAAARLAGNTSATKNFLTQTGTGSVSAAPAWGTIAAGDVPDLAYVDSVTAADTSVVIGGAADTPTVRTNTLDVIATQHPAAADWSNNSHKITSLANGSAAQDAAAYGQTPAGGNTATIGQGGTGATTQQAALDALAGAVTNNQVLAGNGTHVTLRALAAADLPAGTTSAQGALQLDGTTGDIAASPGTAAAGSIGKAADAAHVHPQPPMFAPTGLTGATAASRYAGATTSGPPTSGTFAVGDWVQAQDGPTWLCVTAGTPGSWKQAGDQPWQFRPETYGAKGDMAFAHDLAITSGAAVLTAVGVTNPGAGPTVANSGSGGTIAAGTYQVKFTLATATGETLPSSASSTTTSGSTSTITVTAPAIVAGGAVGWVPYITAAGGSTFFKQTTVTSPWPFQNNFVLTAPPNTSTAQPPGANTTTSSPWSSMSAGQAIRVIGAGAAAADLRTTILSVGGSSATLNANAGTTVSASGAVWGTDDTAAVQSAINAATTYTTANNRTGEVLFSKLYLSNTAPTVGGNYGGNCVIQLPDIANGLAKQRVSLIGISKDVSTLPTYQQMVPEMSGTGIIYIGPAGTNDGTYGAAHVFGTPTNPNIFVTESGNIPGTTNIKVMTDSLRIIVPFAGGIGGIDLFSAAETANYNLSTQALGIVPSGGSWKTIPANGPSTNQFGWGIREPAAGNNAQSFTEQFTCEGLCYGYGPSEHLVFLDVFVAYCVTGLESYAGNGITMVHNGHGVSAGVEFCTNAIGGLDGAIKLDIDNLRTESTSKVLFDPSNRVQGRIGVRDQGAAGAYKSAWVNTGQNAVLVNLMTVPGPITSPQAAPATTVAWVNYYYLNAWMTVSLSGGNTFSAFTITGGGVTVSQANAVGVSTYGFLLGAGQSYTPSYAAGTLTHTVTLLPT